MTHSADQFQEQLAALQPPGKALPADLQSVWAMLLGAVAEEFARIDGRAADLRREMNPKTTSELLGAWEQIFGLPDDCAVLEQTENERRNALLIRMASVGGQSRAYFTALALHFGLHITITEPTPFLVGLHGCGDPVGGSDWRFVWEVHSAETPSANTRTLFECAINALKPAHTSVTFRYGSEPVCPPSLLHDGSVLHDGTIDYDSSCVLESLHDGSHLHDGSITYGA